MLVFNGFAAWPGRKFGPFFVNVTMPLWAQKAGDGNFREEKFSPRWHIAVSSGESKSSLTGSLIFPCYSLIGSKKFPVPPSREFEKKMAVFH
jgi:hypothetical protein